MLLLIALLAAPQLVASFDDDSDDVSYVTPRDTGFQDGDFDLRRFAVSTDGDDLLFEVRLGAPFRQPAVSQRTQQTDLQLWNNVYLQNIDIYVDTDRTRTGYSICIPGRRVAFAGGRTWKEAVVITPQPGAARAVAEDAMGEAAGHVIFAQGLEVRGRTVTARVPALAFGGPPQKWWGYSVHVSGASWERSFTVTDRLRGIREANAFTMPVVAIPEAYAFGGAPPGELHPRVVDVLLPRGADQKALLRSFTAGSFARLPFVELEQQPVPSAKAPASAAGAAPAAAPGTAAAPATVPAPERPKPAPSPELKVSYVAGNMISLAGSVPGLEPMQFGEVLGPDGNPVARVVVVQVIEGGVVVSAVEGAEKIKSGARVRFSPSRPRP